ncbi:MAG: hypothetical protein Q9182_005411 [Xanthomendoza sp. 2 TL-2023]
MHASVPSILAASSFYFGNIAAAPAASPPNARDVAHFESSSPITTSTTPNVDLPVVTSMPVEKRQGKGDIYLLNDIVIPQHASARSSSSTSLSSSTFAFVITRPTKAPTPSAAEPADLVERVVAKAAANPDESLRSLADLSFPQMISSSSSTTASPTPTNELNPNISSSSSTTASPTPTNDFNTNPLLAVGSPAPAPTADL